MPFFSIIIPVYNRNHLVRNAIDSVIGQTFRDHEIIVVDDGSTDETPRIEDDYRGRVRYIRQDNRGVSAARNAGLAASRSPWTAFLDSDDRWLPPKLERQARYIEEHPDITIHQTGETWIRNSRRVNPRDRHLKRDGHIFPDSLELCLISPSAVVMDRSLFETFGLFDETLAACEDYDLWLRITPDERIGLIPDELVVKLGGHPDQLSRKHWGMDRFRIYAIVKLLSERGETIRPEYRSLAEDTAIRKAGILLDGAKKRGNHDFSQTLREVVGMIKERRYDLALCRDIIGPSPGRPADTVAEEVVRSPDKNQAVTDNGVEERFSGKLP